MDRPNDKIRDENVRKTIEAFERLGDVSKTARFLGLPRQTVQSRLRKAGRLEKPVMEGTLDGVFAERLPLPPKGRVRRFLVTSAQNNTPINEPMWRSMQALAKHYDAAIMVGTFTYNTNAYGKLSVKRGTEKEVIRELTYDPRLEDFIVDRRIELGNGLVWCGEMNILPTAMDPLSGLESYAHRKSAIFPHAKLAMRSIAVMQGEWAKLNFTTGCVTLKNYIQKKEGLKAEHHHQYSCLLVEVNDRGNWFVRQVHADSKGRMQDLDVVADGDKVTVNNPVEAITWGDLHATMADARVVDAAMDMLCALRPSYQFFHDVLEGASINHHEALSPHRKFHTWLRGLHVFEKELLAAGSLLSRFFMDGSQCVVADSNHDGAWIYRWLKEYDYRKDPANAELFLKMQTFLYSEIKAGKMVRDVDLLGHAMALACGPDSGMEKVKFLLADESFLTCGKKIENGMHGHFGPNGQRGTPNVLKNVGRRANTAHTHCAGIWDGLYVAGTSTKLKWDYNMGPSGWTNSHILTYPNGARSIVTLYQGMWRA